MDREFLEAMKRESHFLHSETRAIKMVLAPTLRAVMSNPALRKEYEEMLGDARTSPRSAPPEATEEEVIQIMAIASAARWLETVSSYMDDPLRSRPALGAVPPAPPKA